MEQAMCQPIGRGWKNQEICVIGAEFKGLSTIKIGRAARLARHLGLV